MTEFVNVCRTIDNNFSLRVVRDGKALEAVTSVTPDIQGVIIDLVSTIMEVSNDDRTVSMFVRDQRANGGIQHANCIVFHGDIVVHGYGEDEFEDCACAKAVIDAFNSLLHEHPDVSGNILLGGEVEIAA